MKSGQDYFTQGKYQDAAIQFRNALQADPRLAQAHYELGRCYLKLEIWSGAYSSFQRAVDLDPSNRAAQLELARLLVMGQEFNRARDSADLLEDAVKRSPGNATFCYHLGLTYQKAGNGKAKDMLERALKLQPQAPWAEEVRVTIASL